jgi:hypothetical protein
MRRGAWIHKLRRGYRVVLRSDTSIILGDNRLFLYFQEKCAAASSNLKSDEGIFTYKRWQKWTRF